jgi:hypothetical protein
MHPALQLMLGGMFGMIVGTFFALAGLLTVDSASKRGPVRMRRATLIGTVIVIAIWIVGCIGSTVSNSGEQLFFYALLTPMLAYAVVAELRLRFMTRFVSNLIAAADELANTGPSILQWLDADGDGVVSVMDVQSNKQNALSQPGVSANLVDCLKTSMHEFGHNVGTEVDECYVLGKNDIAAAPKKLRRTYMNWSPEFVAKSQ